MFEAQQRHLDLAVRAKELGVACGLLHSRFTADDRRNIEDQWVNLFGKAGWPQRGDQGRILIGTQVLEQSLDIDADFMVTRFALPICYYSVSAASGATMIPLAAKRPSPKTGYWHRNWQWLSIILKSTSGVALMSTVLTCFAGAWKYGN